MLGLQHRVGLGERFLDGLGFGHIKSQPTGMALYLHIQSAHFGTSSAEVWDGLFSNLGGVLAVKLELVAWTRA
jgi:hypothetical protein